MSPRQPTHWQVGRSPTIRLVAAIVTVALALVSVWSTPALGWHALGCKFASGLLPSLSYEFNSVNAYNQDAFNNAQMWWDWDTSPTTYFYPSFGDVNIEVYDVWDYSTNKSAWWSYGCTSGVFSSHEGKVYFNDVHMPSSAYAKNVVGVHELGHAYGLDEEYMSCQGTPKVMEQGSEK